MATAAPPVLSNLAGLLLRRPPSLQELIVRLGYAEDYAWFAGLVRRLFFPRKRRRRWPSRTWASGWNASPGSSKSDTYPSAGYSWISGSTKGRRCPALHLAQAGHPLRADGLRLRRPPRAVGWLPGGAVGLGPPGPAPRHLLRRPRRNQDGLAGVGSPAHSAGNPAPHPLRWHSAGGSHRSGAGNRV